MKVEELAEHFRMSTNQIVYQLFEAGLIYRREYPCKPTPKAFDQWICQVKNGEFDWDENELFY